jgi:hypothetical protein
MICNQLALDLAVHEHPVPVTDTENDPLNPAEDTCNTDGVNRIEQPG